MLLGAKIYTLLEKKLLARQEVRSPGELLGVILSLLLSLNMQLYKKDQAKPKSKTVDADADAAKVCTMPIRLAPLQSVRSPEPAGCSALAAG